MNNPNKFEDFQLIRNKNHFKDPADGSKNGGFYKLNNQTYMIKNLDAKINIYEYVGSNIARLVIGENAPVVKLIKDESGNVYTASKFIPNFKTLNKFLIEDYQVANECFPYGCKKAEDGSIMLANFQEEKADFISPPIEGAEMVEVLLQVIGCSDTHNYNRGVVNDSQAALVDYGSCFKDYLLKQPYIKNFDKQMIISAIEKITSLNLRQIIRALFEEIKFYYPQEQVRQIKNDMMKEVFKAQESLLMDKDILLFALNHSKTAPKAINNNIRKIGEEAKFILCSMVKKDHSLTQLIGNKCNGLLYFSIQKDIIAAVIYNKTEQFKQLLNEYLTLSSANKLRGKVESSADIEKAFQQMIIFKRDLLFEDSLLTINSKIKDANFISSLMVTAVTYNRTNFLEKIVEVAQCDAVCFVEPIKKSISTNNSYVFDLLIPKVIDSHVALENIHQHAILRENFVEEIGALYWVP